MDQNQENKIIIDREALAKQGDNALGSVRPSVCPSVSRLKKSHYQSKEFSYGIRGRTDGRTD